MNKNLQIVVWLDVWKRLKGQSEMRLCGCVSGCISLVQKTHFEFAIIKLSRILVSFSFLPVALPFFITLRLCLSSSLLMMMRQLVGAIADESDNEQTQCHTFHLSLLQFCQPFFAEMGTQCNCVIVLSPLHSCYSTTKNEICNSCFIWCILPSCVVCFFSRLFEEFRFLG